MPTYARFDLAFERGEGAYLFTADGERYLDFAAGIAVNALGHAHPRLVAALKAQSEKLWHCSNLYQIPEGARLADSLVEVSFADQAFFCNSGAEAVEGAMKLVRRFHFANGQPERTRIIACKNAFHGRTMTALSAADNPKHLEGLGAVSPGFDHVPFGNMNELRAAITAETGAIMVEPIQGEGGIIPGQMDYLRALRQVCDEFGLLLIFDEVQCGMGRTGKLFAYEWAEVVPDVMTLAKGLGGGFPVGAFLATEAAAKGMTAGSHGSTFGGNPLAMAVGNAVLEVLRDKAFLDNVKTTSKYLWNALSRLVDDHPTILTEVRGSGLMIGLKCVVPNGEMVARLNGNRLLTVGAADNVVRLLPPLIIGTNHVDEAVAILDKTCRSWPGGA